MRSHTDALATETGSREGAVREHTPSSMLKKDVTLLEPFVQCWMVDQAGRVPSTPIYRNPFLPEPSSNILPETSRNIEKSVELSGLFWTVLDPSRSFFCTAVLAQRAHWYMCRLWFILCSGPRLKAHWYMHRFSPDCKIVTLIRDLGNHATTFTISEVLLQYLLWGYKEFVWVHQYRLHYIYIPPSVRTGITPGGVTEHAFIVIKVMISQCVSLRGVISKYSTVLLNQIEICVKSYWVETRYVLSLWNNPRHMFRIERDHWSTYKTIPRFVQIKRSRWLTACRNGFVLYYSNCELQLSS